MRTSPRVVAVAVALLLGGGACSGDDDDGASGDIEGLVVERVGPYDHIDDDLDYDRPAPSGGDHPHAPFWLNCGVYDGAVPDELAVHSLEHGAVWIALGPGSTDDDRAAAIELREEVSAKVIVSDVPDLPNPVELVAWGFRLPLDTAADDRAAAFVERFVDAPTAPEAGAFCERAVGEPPTPPELSFEG